MSKTNFYVYNYCDYFLSIDITELTTILGSSSRPNVRQLLESNLRTLHNKKQSLIDVHNKTNNSTNVSSSSSSSTPIPVSSSSTTSTTRPSTDLTYLPVEKWGWEQNNEYVTILCYDLPEVGKIKDKITCEFTSNTLDLIIPDLHNKNYRLRVLNFDKEIIPEESKIKVKKNSIDILLKKKGKYDHWIDLVSKKTKDMKKKSDNDPGAGITDMLKQMYDDGDDQMKKVIAEAFVKSRQEQNKQPFTGSPSSGDDL